MSDGDYLPGDPQPTGPVPPEPPGEFRRDMHTRKTRRRRKDDTRAVAAVIAFLERDYRIHLQPVTVRAILRVAREAG